MEEYKGNSNKAKEQQRALPPEKKVEKIVSGPVKSKKKNGIQKITSIFVPEDVEDVKSYIFEDIVVPAVKDIILDAVRALLGVSGKSNKGAPASKVSYRSYYDRGNERNDYGRTRTRVGYDYDDIVLDKRDEAEDVLSRMDELISTYGMASVADLYELVGVTGNYTDNKYGWTDIRSASAIRVRDGYLLKLPKALPLN